MANSVTRSTEIRTKNNVPRGMGTLVSSRRPDGTRSRPENYSPAFETKGLVDGGPLNILIYYGHINLLGEDSMSKKSRKTKRDRNADRSNSSFQQFAKITTEMWEGYLRFIANLDYELVDGGSLLYPNIALFVQTDKHYILELLGSSEVYKGLSVKTHTEPNIHKYLYQFEFGTNSEANPVIMLSSNAANSGMTDLILTGPEIIDKFEKRFEFIQPYKQGSILKGINASGSLVYFGEGLHEFYFSRCLLLNSSGNTYRAKQCIYMEVLSSSFNLDEYRGILENRLFRGIPASTQGLFGVHYVPDSEHQSWLLSGQFTNMFLVPGIRETTIGEFLKANPDVIHKAFGCKNFVYEPELDWIEGNERYPEEKSINPDLMIEREDGFFDIVDLKTIIDKSKSITKGEHKRRRFIDYVNEGIAQLNNYRDYFSYEKNSTYAFSKYKIKVKNPTLYLVVGSYDNVSDEEVREASRSHRNDLVIIDYDTLNSLFLKSSFSTN